MQLFGCTPTEAPVQIQQKSRGYTKNLAALLMKTTCWDFVYGVKECWQTICNHVLKLKLLCLFLSPTLFPSIDSFLLVHENLSLFVSLSLSLCFSQVWEWKSKATWRWYSLPTISHCNPMIPSALEKEARVIEICVWVTVLDKAS